MPEQPVNPLPAADVLDTEISPPTEVDIRRAIKALRNGEAAGIDTIYADMLKAGLPTSTRVLINLYKNIWEKEINPKVAGPKVTLSSFPRRAMFLKNCDNWQSITLLSIPSKVFCRILLTRIEVAARACWL